MKIGFEKSGDNEVFAWVGTEKEYVSSQAKTSKQEALKSLVESLYESHKKLQAIKKAIK